ncbi:MAG: hypothetical protein PF569_07900 [Candidatus Woesearchaeota archaeon]|jgi:hypothetical protein|nr:hypothetical protein [Candidatus Woesearchaeota archaeon]
MVYNLYAFEGQIKCKIRTYYQPLNEVVLSMEDFSSLNQSAKLQYTLIEGEGYIEYLGDIFDGHQNFFKDKVARVNFEKDGRLVLIMNKHLYLKDPSVFSEFLSRNDEKEN